ncbi:envelope stress response membrane protein PspB [Vibrio metoecus]|uniref:Envelope stress response membrane protein PspB n=1 Tax=Vibrio metoecus TaxID=1481663 RepID=A0A067BF52_VIBMT|nr:MULTISPECIES: envelope stress response membrane protein PspB [Vibrio]EEX65777.1 phage shock protein B [Vibrio metoecus]KDO13437.1 phage-shock protein [Vibrio metoecus]KQA17662.1 phage-shock protein [Vibrio metoecus]KQA18904.1 phage-shock protein [Vibrio metoecus]KQA23805.1 phage-shock protein [Vibrio metoecus]
MSSFFIAVPLIVFCIFVAPLWLLLHYRSKRRAESGLSDEEMRQLHSLSEKAERLRGRVENLERILDAEAPNWRRHYE